MPKIIKTDTLFSDIKILIEQTRAKTAIVVNSALTLMYWQVGQKINNVILENKRAEYGEEIVYTLSRQLNEESFTFCERRAFTIGYTRLLQTI